MSGRREINLATLPLVERMMGFSPSGPAGTSGYALRIALTHDDQLVGAEMKWTYFTRKKTGQSSRFSL